MHDLAIVQKVRSFEDQLPRGRHGWS